MIKDVQAIINSSSNISNEQLKKELFDLSQKVLNKGDKFRVINAGLLKAGKSSLFNAIIGESEVFKTGVIRETILNSDYEMENYILTDTPGLDANDEDTAIAMEGYKLADIILFVHNIVDGELNKIETDYISEIGNMFGSVNNFFEKSILVLSHGDQMENANEVLEVINNQCLKLYNCKFSDCVIVDSIGYIKGLEESKELLVKESNIKVLHKIIEENLQNLQISCFSDYVKTSVENLKNDINKEITDLKAKFDVLQGKKILDKNKLLEIKNSIENKMEKSILDINSNYGNINRRIEKPYLSSFKRSYQRYSSRSSAESAAGHSCLDAMNAGVKYIKEQARAVLSECSDIINGEGMVKKLKDDFYDAYVSIKKEYYSYELNEKDVLGFELKINIPKSVEKAKSMYNFRKGFYRYVDTNVLKSKYNYLHDYSSNMYIEEDYEEQYVEGLFGGKWKDVKFYTWEIDGAVDDIEDDVKEYLNNILSEVTDPCAIVYNEIKNDLALQFRNLVKEILTEMDGQINKAELSSQELENKKENIRQEIQDLELILKSL